MPINNYKLTDLDKLVSLSKRRGIIFPSSEIYGGLASVWDYGPVGVEIKRNIKDLWWKSFVSEREDILGFDASILMHPNVWQASGHLDSFSDPLVECSETGKRYREDNIFIIETEGKDKKQLFSIEANDIEDAKNQIKDKSAQITNLKDHEENNLPSPEGGILSEPSMFNLMFNSFMGPLENENATV